MILGSAFLLVVLFICIWNLDIILRLFHDYQSGSLTREKVTNDLASFDLDPTFRIAPGMTRRSGKDGMIQLYVPQGEFLMGESDHPNSNHYPQHKVYVDSFWIDQVAVTNSMYAACMQTDNCTQPAIAFNPHYGKWAYRDYPVTYITWWQARAYCAWVGKRLPTEAEYEKAARGTDGRTYPWGNEPPTPALANFGGLIGEAVSAYRYPLGASPYGALGMSGNVREWVWDWFDSKYYAHSPYANPQGPDNGVERSMRGGSAEEDDREIATYRRYNHDPLSPGLSRGFRCVESAGLAN
jgi:formylglycine-generating enzyme required for sulfatase activity